MMHPTSSGQFEAATAGRVPGLEVVRDGIWCVGLPHSGTVPYTLTYLIADAGGDLHIVDPGPDTERNWELLETAVASVGGGLDRVASATVTHLHPDHLGLASRLRKATGARIAMHREEAAALAAMFESEPTEESRTRMLDDWGVPAERRDDLPAAGARTRASAPVTIDVLLEHDDPLSVPGRELRVIATPGHTTGHICLRDVGERLVFTGDHVLPQLNPGIGLGGPTDGNPLTDYLASLDRVAVFDDHEALPAHGHRFDGLASRCGTIARHHLGRAAEVSAIVADDGGLSVWETASRIRWSAGWTNLRGVRLQSALSQTAMHLDFGARSRPL